MLGRSIGKNSLLLASFALVTAALLGGTYQLTREHIAQAERAAAQAALTEIIHDEQRTNNLLEDTLSIPEPAWAQLGLADGGLLHGGSMTQENCDIINSIVASVGYSRGCL